MSEKIQLEQLITAVKEQNLEKDQLEAYRDQLSGLFAKMMLEIADLEKAEAVFMAGKGNDESVANRKVAYKGTEGGLRLITLKRYCSATKELLNSLKSRLYSIY